MKVDTCIPDAYWALVSDCPPRRNGSSILTGQLSHIWQSQMSLPAALNVESFHLTLKLPQTTFGQP